MKTAIVLGATGLIGKALVKQLESASHIDNIVSVTRKPVEYASPKVTNRVIDFDDMESHADVFNGDVLFSALGTTVKQAGSIDAQRVVDLDYQLSAATIAASNGVEHYLLVSSSGANAKSLSPYLKMKGELEKAIASLGFARVSLFQPSLLLGDREQRRLGEEIGAAVLPALCRLPGLKRYRPISGEQVAKKMVEISGTQGESFERFVLDEIFI